MKNISFANENFYDSPEMEKWCLTMLHIKFQRENEENLISTFATILDERWKVNRTHLSGEKIRNSGKEKLEKFPKITAEIVKNARKI